MKFKDTWTTREGEQLKITEMASSHLLATIHYIERNRFMNAAESFANGNVDVTNLYLRWPIQYELLIAEAQKRNLIYRDVQGLVKRRVK